MLTTSPSQWFNYIMCGENTSIDQKTPAEADADI